MGKIDAKDTRKDVAYFVVNNGTETFREDNLGSVPFIGSRHWQCLWHFVMLILAYGTRVSLSVAIVAMTDPKTSTNPDIPTYPHWTQKGAILSAFFWGYVWPQILAGYVAHRFGAKWFLIVTMGVQSVLGVLTPYTAAQFGANGMMAVRAIQGFSQGFFFPIVTHVLSQWVPPQERARLANVTFAAVPFGTVLALLITGVIAQSPYGWPMVFYLYGVLGVVWCVLFSFFGYNTPADHTNINQAEKYYIETSLGRTEKKKSHAVPWKALFTSVPVWALVFTQCGWVFGFWILLTQIPTYMNYVMNFNIKDNSVLSSMPYITQLILGFIISFLSDILVNKGHLKQTVARKVFNTLGCVIPAAALILLAFTKNTEPTRAVILLIIAVGSGACGPSGGWGLNHMDLSSDHSGTLMGLCNAVSNILSIWAPLMVQILVKNETDPEQWKIIFFTAAGTYVVSSLIFICFGSAKRQPWNDHENKDIKK